MLCAAKQDINCCVNWLIAIHTVLCKLLMQLGATMHSQYRTTITHVNHVIQQMWQILYSVFLRNKTMILEMFADLIFAHVESCTCNLCYVINLCGSKFGAFAHAHKLSPH